MTSSKAYKRGDLFSSTEAYALLGSGDIGGAGDSLASAKDKWRKRIVEAVKTGELRKVEGKFLIEELVGWARSATFRKGETCFEKFRGLPANLSLDLGECAVPPPQCEISVFLQYDSAEERVNRKLAELQAKIDALESENDRLKPLAEAKERHAAQCRENGSKHTGNG